MQITADASVLRAAVGAAVRLVPSRPTLPILSHVLLAVEADTLTVTATNLDAALTLTVPVAGLTPGQATAPARLLHDWLASVDGPVTLAAQARYVLKLTAGRTTTTLRGLDPEDFPNVALSTDGAIRKIAADGLRRAIDEVAYAAAPDDSRPVMSGVLLRATGAECALAAADGYRLAVRQIPLLAPESDGEAPWGAIVPQKALSEVGRLCGDATVPVTLRIDGGRNRLYAEGEGWTLLTRLIEGQFPDYNRVIPQHPTTRVTVNRGELLHTLRFAASLARDNAFILRLQMTASADPVAPATLHLSATAQDVGDHAVTLAVALDGGPARIALNVVYLREALEALSTGEVVLGITGASSPARLEPVGGDGPLAVVMPMQCADWPKAPEPALAEVGA